MNHKAGWKKNQKKVKENVILLQIIGKEIFGTSSTSMHKGHRALISSYDYSVYCSFQGNWIRMNYSAVLSADFYKFTSLPTRQVAVKLTCQWDVFICNVTENIVRFRFSVYLATGLLSFVLYLDLSGGISDPTSCTLLTLSCSQTKRMSI